MYHGFGDSRGPNDHAPRTDNKQGDQNLQSLTTDFLIHHVHVHHQFFFHRILRNFHHEILHGLFLSIGLAPDFDSLGPYQHFVLDLLGVVMP